MHILALIFIYVKDYLQNYSFYSNFVDYFMNNIHFLVNVHAKVGYSSIYFAFSLFF